MQRCDRVDGQGRHGGGLTDSEDECMSMATDGEIPRWEGDGVRGGIGARRACKSMLDKGLTLYRGSDPARQLALWGRMILHENDGMLSKVNSGKCGSNCTGQKGSFLSSRSYHPQSPVPPRTIRLKTTLIQRTLFLRGLMAGHGGRKNE